MPNAVNLVVFAGDQPWSVLQSVVHWHRTDRPLRRLGVFRNPVEERAGLGGQALVRFLRESFPDLKVEVREGGWDPAGVRAHLEVWHRSDPGSAWILNLAGVPEGAAWAADPWIGRPGCTVLQRRPDTGWIELRRDADGRIEAAPFAEFRRETTDEVPVNGLLRALGAELAPADPAAAALPLVRLTEALVRNDWRWPEAFESAGVRPGAGNGADSGDRLFQAYLAGLLSGFGVKQVTLLAPGAPSPHPALWLNHGGRLVAVDASLATSESAAPEPDLLGLAAALRTWPGIPCEGLWIRPGSRVSDTHRALAATLGIQLFDEADAGELPSRLARWIQAPLSPEGTEIERLLRHHLASTGRTRVYAAESALLRGQTGSGADPVLADADRWLEQVRHERRQNWQAWSHRGSLQVRVPSAGAGNPTDDWRLLVSVVLRVDPHEVTAASVPGGVVLTLADRPETRSRLAQWFRPFLNSQLTFVAARDRLAAEARAAAEAPAREPATAPAPSTHRSAAAAASSNPSPSHPAAPRRSGPAPASTPASASSSSPGSAPRPKAAAPSRPMRKVSLEDLDRALDDALGG